MSCPESLATIGSLPGAGAEMTMAEATTTTTVSRRSTRMWAKDGESVEMLPAGTTTYEPRGGSSSDDDKEIASRETKTVMDSLEPRTAPVADLGIDMSELFPTSPDVMGKHVSSCLQAANTACKSMDDGKPINFGCVLPGAIYRSSFPTPETLPFLGTLGLRTVLSLVNKDLPDEFRDFMASNGIRHCIVEMQGTKRVEIPDAVMNTIMEIALNKENHPLLIHCNHGKHRTGCAVAVLRHISGWQVDQIVQEYQGFAEPKVRECDIKYITEYKTAKLVGFFRQKRNQGRGSVITSSKMRSLLLASAAAIAIWITTGVLWGEGYL